MVLTAHCSLKAASMKTVPTVGTVGKLYILMTGGGSTGGDLLQHPHMDILYLNRMAHPSCKFVSHFPISAPLYLLFPPCRMPSSRPEIIICRAQCKRKIFFRKQERLKVLKRKLFTFFLLLPLLPRRLCCPIRLLLQNTSSKTIKGMTAEHKTKCRTMCTAEVARPLGQPSPHPSGPFSVLPIQKDKSKAVSAGQVMKCPCSGPLP